MISVLDRAASMNERVDDVLRCFVEEQANALGALDCRLDALSAEVLELVAAGGKRLRPAFVYWGHRAAGGGDEQAAIHAGAAVEMLHTFALLHDDVMDRADTRRGTSCRHARVRRIRRWNAARATRRGSAPAQRSWPAIWPSSGRIDLLDRAPVGAAAAARLRERLHHAAPRGDGRPVPRPAPRRRPTSRSGDRLPDRAAEVRSVHRDPPPAARAAPSPTTSDRISQRALDAYGDAIGVAFQMRDDILGLFGDPARTGKGCLDDIRAGKRTLLDLASPRT